jgi:hypothetical protein
VTTIPAAKRSSLRAASVGPFPLITLVVVIVIGLAAFLAATYLETFDDGGGEPRSNGADTFSRSAIGHRAFAASLRNLDVPVQISRFRSIDKAGAGSLLLVIEPNFDASPGGLLTSIHRVPHALLVLPKWDGTTDRKKPIWIERMDLLPEEAPSSILRAVASDAKLMRDEGTATIETPRFGGSVTLTDPQYMLSGSDMRIDPIISSSGKILLGAMKIGPSELWILSDPDLLSNAGIDDSGNGIVAISIVDALLPKGGGVLIDETLHGFEQRPNLMRTLLRPPFVPILVATIAAALVLAWAGVMRFGAPQAEADGLAPGKLTLIKSAAKLLRFGTSAGNLLLSYRRMVLADVMSELHGPTGLDEPEQAAWLDRAAAHRGLDTRLDPLHDRISALTESGRIDATRALRFAHELYRWKQEILHGTVIVPRGRRNQRRVEPLPADGAQGRR